MTIKPRTRADIRHFVGIPKLRSIPCPLHPTDTGLPSNRKRCCECFRIARRARFAAQGETIGSRYASARSAAKLRGHEFAISLSEFEQLVSQPCVYQYSGPAAHIGIDRIDATRGYVPGNCQPCCGKHNQFKSDILTDDQMHDAVKRYAIPCGDTGAGRQRINTSGQPTVPLE